MTSVAAAVWERTLERHPLARVRSGLPVTALPNRSLDEVEEGAAFARDQLAALEETSDDALTKDFLRAALTDEADAPDRWWWHFPVTPYQLYDLTVVAPQVLPAVSDRRAFDASVVDALRVAGSKLDAMAARGWLVPSPALDGVCASLEAIRSGPLSAGTEVIDAIDAVLRTVARHTDRAPAAVGLGQYDGGNDAYRRLVRLHATFDITPEEVHELGTAQVEVLTARMAEVQGRLGIDGDEGAMREHLRRTGVLHASSPEDVERRYRRAIARVEPVLSDAFAVQPATPYDVARLDAALEPAMTYGYYEFPTGDRPVGRYRYNGSGLDTRSQVNAAALIYHELVPGHHFHVARQTENMALPPIRRESTTGIGLLTAYQEGWAEYAAHVAGELGMYADPIDEYGRLIHERFMAARLVLDTGMNALGWPLEHARDVMRRLTTESETQVATDTLRYSTDLPGQAIAYRLGDLKLRELRERAGVDLRTFHELVLGPGALHFDVLAAHIQRETRS